MIIVTGTKRSGTSMWMQILRSAGVPIVGSAFPKDWKEVIGAANPEGFYESNFRMGIHFQTNPDPKTGAYMHPAQVRGHAVKVFVPGLVRTDLAFVGKVLATMRNWREYYFSVNRLFDMEEANRTQAEGVPAPHRPSPVLEWWGENHALILDHLTRRYPLHLIAYEEAIDAPERVIPEVIVWLGAGDVEAAKASVKPALNTQKATELPPVPDVDPAHAAVFDELYLRVRWRRELDDPFIDRLNETHEALLPALRAEQALVAKRGRERMRARAKRKLEATEPRGE